MDDATALLCNNFIFYGYYYNTIVAYLIHSSYYLFFKYVNDKLDLNYIYNSISLSQYSYFIKFNASLYLFYAST